MVNLAAVREKKGVNMETVTASQRTAVDSFGSGGMALLPWTKHMLTVLWEQLRLLLQVIYYSCVSVFQMFRFEVHVRITDETGQHIQTNSTESFLFSSLFERDNSGSSYCADVSDPFTGKSTAEALLSSLRADDLCCGLVDDFVSRTAATEEGIFLGHQSSWKMGFPHDWNIFVSSAESSGTSDSCHQDSEKLFKRCSTEEERSCHWSSEEEQNVVEFDSEESKALWESLSKSTDPYNPFFFSACISTTTHMREKKSDVKDFTDTGIMSINKACEESSWTSSDCSSPDIDREESERLWDFFSSPTDPYNPMCFTASTVSSSAAPAVAKQQASLPAPPPESTSDTEEEEESISGPASSDEDEEDQLWKSLSRTNDPYHPLNFQACLQTSSNTPPSQHKHVAHTPAAKLPKASRKPRAAKACHTHDPHPEKIVVPWRRTLKKDPQAPEPERQNRADHPPKQVRFSPHVHVHVMRTWPFARQASRKGPWEEIARDRDRFQKRILETERVLGPCFSPAHRAVVWERLQRVRCLE